MRPATSGSTSPVALAAPVVVGIIDMAAARARRRSLCGRSRICWSFVYAWIVVIRPCRNPNESLSTFTTGARQFVVQLAFEMMWWVSGSYMPWFTPSTIVTSSSLAGAVMIAFLAPASRCFEAETRSRKIPVASTTMSTPRSAQGSPAGSLSLRTRMSSPSTRSPLSVTSTVPGYRPCTES